MIGFGSVTAQYNCSTMPSSACSELEPARVRRTQGSHGMLSIAFIRNTTQSQSKNESKHKRQGPAPSALQTNQTRQGTRHFSENRPRSQEPSKAVGVKGPSASSTTTATSLLGLSMFVQSLCVIKMFKSSMCLPSLRMNPPRQTTADLVAVSALRLCSKHMEPKNQNIDARQHRCESRNHRCRRFAKDRASRALEEDMLRQGVYEHLSFWHMRIQIPQGRAYQTRKPSNVFGQSCS